MTTYPSVVRGGRVSLKGGDGRLEGGPCVMMQAVRPLLALDPTAKLVRWRLYASESCSKHWLAIEAECCALTLPDWAEEHISIQHVIQK
jgi:hypothetical protein